MAAPLLQISDLTVSFFPGLANGRNGRIRAVDSLSLEIEAGETLALVGESGSGKSVTALSILGLIDAPGRIEGGSIRFAGTELTDLNAAGLRAIRGNRIAMIFQEPMTSLNPALTIGKQLAEPLRLHRRLSRREARAEAAELLGRVALPDARMRLDDHPHRLSGGMRQRVMIAMALACDPDLIIADEPTTALDVTVQAQILALLQEMTGGGAQAGTPSRSAPSVQGSNRPSARPHHGQRASRNEATGTDADGGNLVPAHRGWRAGRNQAVPWGEGTDVAGRRGAALLLITHDLGVVAGCADRVAVMYAGRIVETAPAPALYAAPRHPYTQGLLRSLPRRNAPSGTPLQPIAGQPPNVARLPSGCAFAPRCPHAKEVCRQRQPALLPKDDRAAVACHLHG